MKSIYIQFITQRARRAEPAIYWVRCVLDGVGVGDFLWTPTNTLKDPDSWRARISNSQSSERLSPTGDRSERVYMHQTTGHTRHTTSQIGEWESQSPQSIYWPNPAVIIIVHGSIMSSMKRMKIRPIHTRRTLFKWPTRVNQIQTEMENAYILFICPCSTRRNVRIDHWDAGSDWKWHT